MVGCSASYETNADEEVGVDGYTSREAGSLASHTSRRGAGVVPS